MNTELETLALEYAAAMQRYYELRAHTAISGLREDQYALRRAYDNMLNLHNEMTLLAESLA